MPTTQRSILDAVLARLRASPAMIAKPTERIRIAHRTPITKENSPAIRVVPIGDSLIKSAGDCDERRLEFRVEVLGRDDGGVASIDALVEGVLERLKPARGDAIAYPAGVRLKFGRVTLEEEDADADVAYAALAFEADYSVPAWTLGG